MKKTKFKQTEIGKIPEDWEFRPVSFFCSKITSGGTPSRAKKEFWEKASINWLKTKELLDGNIYSTEEKISESGLKNSSAKLFPKETVIMAMYGATVGKLGITKIETSTNQACCAMIVDKNKSIPRFLFYELLYNRKKLINLSSGAAQQNLNQDIIKEFYLPFPPHPEQSAIAKILSDLDSKIELNQQMNKTLEAIGQAIFKRWFVNFEFPNEEGKPYTSFGGEMIFNEELGKEIPKGWNIKEIKEFGKMICGKTPPKSNENYFNGEVPFIKIPDMHNKIFIIKTEDSLSEEGRKYQENKTIPAKSICVSCIATVGLVSLSSEDSQTNQQINSIIPERSEYTYYLYFLLKSMYDVLQDYGSGGSATLNINTKTFSNIEILFPDKSILKAYDDILNALFEKILKDLKESENLSQIRDSLLPKLMSGKIRVPVEE